MVAFREEKKSKVMLLENEACQCAECQVQNGFFGAITLVKKACKHVALLIYFS